MKPVPVVFFGENPSGDELDFALDQMKALFSGRYRIVEHSNVNRRRVKILLATTADMAKVSLVAKNVIHRVYRLT